MNRTLDRRRRRGFLAAIIDAIDEQVSARANARARELGLSISRVPGTRVHRYRNDALWDRRRACEGCAGTGLDGAWDCPWCDGTGVVTLDPALSTGDLP